MASFQTHLTFGVALGGALVAATVGFSLVDVDASSLLILGLLTVIGALLPDIDSDSGIPFHVTFGALALMTGGIALFFAYASTPEDLVRLAAYPLLTMFMMWVVIGGLFKKFTCHRGMAHSIPAALIAGLVLFSLARWVGIDEWLSFLYGVATALGYLSHLVLDELYAAVNFHGHFFVPNKALGSALKFFSHSRPTNVAVYGVLFCFLLGNGENVALLARRLWQAFS